MLNWDYFEKLSGDKRLNFEKICRAVINEKYTDKGLLHEICNQPGVEFYIELNKKCNRLGSKGDLIGWQCKWFDYQNNGRLSSSSKRQIEDSLEKSKKHLTSLKKWILWTHKLLSKSDQEWFYSLKEKYEFQLVLWNDKDLEDLLDESALYLKETYFGELALTPQELEKQHEISSAPVASRWCEAVHQTTDVETEIRKVLGEVSAWEELDEYRCKLNEGKELVKKSLEKSIYKAWDSELKALISFIEEFIHLTEVFSDKIDLRTIRKSDVISRLLHLYSRSDISTFFKLLRKLRRNNLSLSLTVTNILYCLKEIAQFITEFEETISKQYIAVIGGAGNGKTELSIDITRGTSYRPAGVLILGRNLGKNFSLDELVRANISFYGSPVKNFESLLAALNAVAERHNCRLPLVIDGLNEAESPRQWKDILSKALVLLRRYPNVVLICTLRPQDQENVNIPAAQEEYLKTILSDGFSKLVLNGFSELTSRAVSSYFNHYKIQTDLLAIPPVFLKHPLTLRLFCETMVGSNLSQHQVGFIPSSTSYLFEKRVKHSLNNILNIHQSLSEDELTRAVYVFGQCLFESGRRYVDETSFIKKFGEEKLSRNWNENIINLFVQEGLIFRDEDQCQPYKYNLRPTYDLMGGYYISDYLLRTYSHINLENWVNRSEILEKLFIKHELAYDVLHSLIPIIPKKYNKKQLWRSLTNLEYQIRVLDQSQLIDQQDFDEDTRTRYKERQLSLLKENSFRVFQRLDSTSLLPSHPLNSIFEDEILSSLTMATRDIYWTEYLRLNKQEILNEIEYFQILCQKKQSSSDVLKLFALHISWMLTSTDNEIRDESTKALVLFGLIYPEFLFQLTLEKFDINDPYVLERLLAASYVVALQSDTSQRHILNEFAVKLFNRMFADEAEFPTTHALIIDYVYGILNVAKVGVGNGDRKNELLRLYEKNALRKKWGVEAKNSLISSPLGLDFANYTIGRLIPGRRNYDFENSDYIEVKSKILWRIYQLGWSEEFFGQIDRNISEHQRSWRDVKVQRYGKKYSCVAYYEMLGYRLGMGLLSQDDWLQRFHADIDPFFPRKIEYQEKLNYEFLGQSDVQTLDWINAEFSLPSLIDKLNNNAGDWVVLDACFIEESLSLDRNFMSFIHSFLVMERTTEDLSVVLDSLNVDDFNETGTAWCNFYSGELYENLNDASILMELSRVNSKGQIFQTTMNYSWGTSGIDSGNFEETLLSVPLVKLLQLDFDPFMLTYRDKNGNEAVKVVKEKGKGNWNKKEIIYIRKDLLINLLNAEKLTLVYCGRAERRLSLSGHYDDTNQIPYKEIKSSYVYPVQSVNADTRRVA